MDYKAAVVGVSFNSNNVYKYNYEDIFLVGIAYNETEARSLLMDEIFRLLKENGPTLKITEARSEYGEPVTIVEAGDRHYHYYLLFSKEET